MKRAAAAVKEGGGCTDTSGPVLVSIFRLHMFGLNIFRTRLITCAEDCSKICPISEASATKGGVKIGCCCCFAGFVVGYHEVTK